MGRRINLGQMEIIIEEEAPYEAAAAIREALVPTTCLLHGTVPKVLIYQLGYGKVP